MRNFQRFATALFVLALALACRPSPGADPVAPARASAGLAEGPSAPASVAPADPRRASSDRFLDNEAARFIRKLLVRAYHRVGNEKPPPLAVCLLAHGNEAQLGYRLQVGDKIAERPNEVFLQLSDEPASWSHLLLHEGGHACHFIVWRRKPEAAWTPIVHSTFAVTDRSTALTEGYAEHLETLWGQFGNDPTRQAFYQHYDGHFNSAGADALFFFPLADVATISQQWARFSAIRDATAAFEGVAFPGDYLRSQYDPARDFRSLKSPNAMMASEGVVASALFWDVEAQASAAGARPHQGLDQPALLESEDALLGALAQAGSAHGPWRPDVLDVVAAAGKSAAQRWVDVTRGVTVDASMRSSWSNAYLDAVRLDLGELQSAVGQLAQERARNLRGAGKNLELLRSCVGPVLPVRSPKVTLQILGETAPLEFDLNAGGTAEWLALGLDPGTAQKILAERDRQPFTSLDDLKRRTAAQTELVPRS